MRTQPTYVIPCSGQKLEHAAPARELYTGQMFRYTLAKVERAAELVDARVLILSARYGLVELDRELEPYDTTVRRTGTDLGLAFAVRAQLEQLAVGDVIAFVPAAYFRVLDYAVRTSEGPSRLLVDGFAGGPQGIGYQRARLAELVRELEARPRRAHA